MSQSLGLGYDPNYEGFDPQYPFPPRVHWLALLVGWIAVSWLIVLTLQRCLWSTANNVMQMRSANAIRSNAAIVRIIPAIRISGPNVRAGIGA